MPHENLIVMSLGGGPGTDMFSIIASRNHIFEQPPSNFKFRIFDKATEWENTLRSLIGNNTVPGLKMSYHSLDLPRNVTLPPIKIEATLICLYVSFLIS